MSFFLSFFNFILIGIILTVTVRWCLLLWNVYQVKARQGNPLDRMIPISSKDILMGLIRKRTLKTGLLLDSKDVINHNNGSIDESVFNSMYNAFIEQGIKISLTPNEDLYLAKKKGMIDDPSKYYLNDEIIIRLSKREIKDNIAQKRKLDLDEQLKQEEMEKERERQIRLKQQKEIEDRINI